MITTNSILQELPALAQQISQLINNKTAVIPFKLSYAIVQNVKQCKKIEDDLIAFRDKLQKKYCQMDGKNPKTESVEENGQKVNKLLFKSDEDKKSYGDELGDYLNKEVKFSPYKIDMNIVEGIDNIPPNILLVLDKYGIIE